MFDPDFLELVCCKKQQKSPNQETGLENRGPLEALNNTKMILNDEGGHLCPFMTKLVPIIQNLQMSLFPKPDIWLGLFCQFITANRLYCQ